MQKHCPLLVVYMYNIWKGTDILAQIENTVKDVSNVQIWMATFITVVHILCKDERFPFLCHLEGKC